MTLSLLAPAKINSFLHITGKRPDGYHTLQSHILFADYGDDILIEENEGYDLIINGEFSNGLGIENNLITKAVHALCAALDKQPSLKITLTKNIPVGAGLGGGSSDIAVTVKALLKLWNVSITAEKRDSLLLSLGADVPACFHGKSCLVEGIGEHIRGISCAPLHAVLIFPNHACATKSIFENFKNYFSETIQIPTEINLDFIKQQQNDLTNSAIDTAPIIKDVLNILSQQNAITLNRMSGSGSSCFGICKTREEAEKIEAIIRQTHPNLWLKAVSLA